MVLATESQEARAILRAVDGAPVTIVRRPMHTEATIRTRLKRLESEMRGQVEQGMEKGWPVLFWDKNCVERAVLRRVLGLKLKPFCPADTMAGW